MSPIHKGIMPPKVACGNSDLNGSLQFSTSAVPRSEPSSYPRSWLVLGSGDVYSKEDGENCKWYNKYACQLNIGQFVHFLTRLALLRQIELSKFHVDIEFTNRQCQTRTSEQLDNFRTIFVCCHSRIAFSLHELEQTVDDQSASL